MTGKPAASPSRLKHPVVLTAIALALVSAAAVGAWLTRPMAEATRLSEAAKTKPAPDQVAVASPTDPARASSAPSPASPPLAAAAASPPKTETPPPPESARPEGAKDAETAAGPSGPIDWSAVPIAELRTRAETDEIAAMEELARRLVQGIGVVKDQQAGAGWLLRAAQAGSAQSAFNVGVMYERGFVVERDSTRAIEWYRKAVDADLAMAKHNLALLLRDGKGAARNGKEAVELLRSATRQGMAASMFTLGDIYERGDAAPKDPATALAWFAIAAEFERQINKGVETPLAKTATQRLQTLQRVLTPADLERAQQFGQAEFKQIVEAMQPPKPEPEPEPPASAAAPAQVAPPPPPDADPPGWPKAMNDQVRTIQQMLLDLKLLRDKPDGVLGPMTRAAIRSFQKSAAMRETGEPSKELYVAMLAAKGDVVANSPLPPPRPEPGPGPEAKPEPAPEARPEAPTGAAARPTEVVVPLAPPPPPVEFPNPPAKVEAPKVEAAKVDPPAAPKPDAAKVDPPKPAMPPIETEKPASARVAVRPEPSPPAAPPAPPRPVDIGRPEPPPAPPTSADIARAAAPPASTTIDPNAWPTATTDQIRIVQTLLHELHFYREAPDGRLGPATRTAIRDYERAMGLKASGEPSRELFDSLNEIRAITRPKAASSN